MDDTLCVNRPVKITSSLNASSFYWNFCSGNLRYEPQTHLLDTIPLVQKPAFMDFATTDSGIYAFVTNHEKATLTRLFFGNDLMNPPVATDLGSFGGKIPRHTQGIQMINDNGTWFCFVTGGQKNNSKLLRLNFGSHITNEPTVDDLFFPSLLDYPIDLTIIHDNNNWYGFTVNFNKNTLVRFSFGTSLANDPLAETIGNESSFSNPCGITFYNDNQESRFLFITNYGSNSISRLSFGNSLANSPRHTTIYSNGTLQFPFDLTLIHDCEHLFGFVLNRFGDIVQLSFDSPHSLPSFTPLGKSSQLFNPQGISPVFRIGDSIIVFVANIDNSSISQIIFPGCTDANPSWSNVQNPPPVYFSRLGNYNIRLEGYDSVSSEKTQYCKNVEVVDNPTISLPEEILLLPGDTLQLDAGEGFSSYSWSSGQTSRTITVNTFGIFGVTVTNQHGCPAFDSIEVKFAGIPNIITPNGDGINDTWEIRMVELLPHVHITLFDRYGNTITDYDAKQNVWDCTNRGKQPVRADTYWYIMDVGKDHKPQKGQVTVVRD